MELIDAKEMKNYFGIFIEPGTSLESLKGQLRGKLRMRAARSLQLEVQVFTKVASEFLLRIQNVPMVKRRKTAESTLRFFSIPKNEKDFVAA